MERLSWRVTCPSHASFYLFTVAGRASCWTHEELDLALHAVIDLVLQVGDAEKFLQALGSVI